jgi:hypothetical protein
MGGSKHPHRHATEFALTTGEAQPSTPQHIKGVIHDVRRNCRGTANEEAGLQNAVARSQRE